MLLLAEVSKVSVRGHDSRRLVLKGYGKIACVEGVVVEKAIRHFLDHYALFSVTAPLSGRDPVGAYGDYVGCQRYESALEALFELWCDVSVSGMVFDEEDCERVNVDGYLVSSHQRWPRRRLGKPLFPIWGVMLWDPAAWIG